MASKTQKAVVELIVNGRSSEVSLTNLGKAVKTVTKELRDMAEADDPKAYAEKVKEQNTLIAQYIKQSSVVNSVSKELKAYHEHQKDINKAALQGQNLMSKFLGSAAGNIAKGVVSGSFIVRGLEKLAEFLPGLISGSGKLSDELSDVQKQTGLYGKELNNLNEELKTELDTRTKLEELRKFAALAGKNGFENKDDVLAFVRAADVINVALGEDLKGNTEDVINEIGKITKIFNLDKEFGIEKGMLKVASAINTVGASSEANEGYLVEWAKDFAGIAPNAKVSIADTLGLAAAMDITGQSSALSTTNIGKMMIAMGKDVPYFAKLAGMSIKEFSDLLQTDGNAAFIKVLEKAKSTTNGVEGLAKTLEAMGIEGTEGAQILGVLTNNLDLLKQQQAIANAEMAKGTSVLEEFNVKNNNTAAILEKIEKLYDNFIESVSGSLSPFIQDFGLFIGVVSELDLQLAELNEQQKMVAKSEQELTPLINRYDELKKKTKLTTDEQEELKKVTSAIAQIVPGAVTEWDLYGNAMDINSGKTRKFQLEQRELYEVMRQTRRDMLKEEIKDLNKKAELIQYELNLGKKFSVGSMGQTIETKFNENDFNSRSKALKKIQDQIKEANSDLSGLLGTAPPPFKTATTPTSNPGKPNNSGLLPSKSAWDKQKKENDRAEQQQEAANKRLAEKLEQESDRLTEELIKNQQKLTLNALGEYEKEIRAADLHYDELRKRANGNAEQLAQIDEQARLEIESINDKYNAKFEQEKADFLSKLGISDTKFQDKELSSINQHYDKLIEEARKFSVDTVAIEEQRLAAIDNLKKDRQDKSDKDRISRMLSSLDTEKRVAEEGGRNMLRVIKDQLFTIEATQAASNNLDAQLTEDLIQRKTQLQREYHETTLNYINATGSAMSSGVQAISDVLTLAADHQDQYAEFQKGLALFQIAIEAGTAVAAAIASASKGDPYTTALRIATAVAAVTGAFVKAKELINDSEQPSVPKFGDGGFSDRAILTNDSTGYINKSTLFEAPNRRFIAGELGREFMIGGRALQHPAVAAYANMIDSIQKTRNFGALDQISSASASSSSNNADLLSEFRALRAELKAYQQYESKRPVDFSFDKFNRKNDFWLNVKKDAAA